MASVLPWGFTEQRSFRTWTQWTRGGLAREVGAFHCWVVFIAIILPFFAGRLRDKDPSSVSSIFIGLEYPENSTDLIMDIRLGVFIIFPSILLCQSRPPWFQPSIRSFQRPCVCLYNAQWALRLWVLLMTYLSIYLPLYLPVCVSVCIMYSGLFVYRSCR